MIIDFFDQGTEDIYNGINSRNARKTLPVELRKIALRKFYFLENAVNLMDLRIPSRRLSENSLITSKETENIFRYTHV